MTLALAIAALLPTVGALRLAVVPTAGAAVGASTAAAFGVAVSGSPLDNPHLLSANLPTDIVYGAFMSTVQELNHFGCASSVQ